ncbi:MAG: (Fe-S)-binding protein [Actinomycetota bacterium]|nr:(Fe-S)-binding protein [Actinomycetota bacterium]
MLVKNFEIKEILPCLADSEKIRAIAEISDDVREVLPYINSVNQKAIYIKGANTITFSRGKKLITIHPKKIAMTKLKDKEEAIAVLEEVIAMINDVYERKSQIEPDFTRREKPGPLEILKLLPKTNCGSCGLPSCMAFMAKLLNDEISILRCSKLFEPGYEKNRTRLLELLQKSGFDIPSAFN